MGRIANIHLAKLWDFMVGYNYGTDAHPADILERFLECDEALSELQDQRDHWKTMYGNACGDQDVLKESIRLLDTENRRLRQKVSDQEKEINQRRKEADGLYKELDRLRDEKGSLSYQKIRDQEKEIGLLKMEYKNRTDILREKIKTIGQLREENDELKKKCKSLQGLNDDFLEKVIGKDDDIEKLDHMLQDLQREYDKLKNDRDRKAEAVVELAKKRDELQEENAYLRNSRETWRSRAKHAEAEVEELANKRDQLQEENEDLKKKLTEANDILEETNRDRNEWRRQALMTKLTSKVPDIKEEYTMTFTMDKADYNDLMNLLSSKAFGAPPEYMRDSLREFCDDHCSCIGCPLRFSDCDFDNLSDEELEKSYKITILSNSKRAWHGDATAD